MRFFVVYGEPMTKGRPRFSRKTGTTYTPAKTVEYENLIKLSYKNACPDDELFDGDTPLYVKISAYVSIPSSASKKKRQEMLDGKIRPTKKPDVDNIVKTIMDAGNGVIWHDDKSVVEVIVCKWYSDNPRVEVCVDRVEEIEPF